MVQHNVQDLPNNIKRSIFITNEIINGTVGKYEVPSNHQLAPNTSYGDNVYSLKITSMPETGFWFRIGVSGGG